MVETLLKPSSAIIVPEVINLPPADQLMLRFYRVFLLCFRPDPEADLGKVYSELRCGLSDALVEFPFFPVTQIFSTGASDPALILQANLIKGGLILATSLHRSTLDAIGWTVFFKS